MSHKLLLNRIFNVRSHNEVSKEQMRNGYSSHENQDSLNSPWSYGEEKKARVEHRTVLPDQTRLPKFALTIGLS